MRGPAEVWIGQVLATFGGSQRFLACSPRTGFWLCQLGPVVALWLGWQSQSSMIEMALASSTMAQGAVLSGGRCGPYPQARVWSSEP